MTSNSATRVLSMLVVLGLAVAACDNGDDDDSSSTTGTSAESDTTEAPSTNAPATTEGAPELTGEGLAVGVLVPPPGLLATLFEAQLRGIDFAAADIAGGGGVLGGPLNVTRTATPLGQTELDVVGAAVDGGARALIGPAGSTAAKSLLPELSNLGTVACSASATLAGLLSSEEAPALFRTVVGDDVLTAYLSDRIVERRDTDAPDAAWKVAIVARADDYGLSVGNGLAASLQARGLAPSVIGYPPQRVTFADTATEVAALQPDVTILISYEEGPSLLSALMGAGLAPDTMVGLDGFFAPRVAQIAGGDDPTSVDGFRVLGTTGDRAFLARLTDDDSNGQVAYAAQAYDCAIVLALAAEEVDLGNAETISLAVRTVTADGTTCTTYADCHAKLAAGEDIDYDGPSGRLAIDEHGDPTSVRFTTGQIQGGVLAEVTATDIDLADLADQQAAFAAASFTTRLQQALRFLGFYNGPIDGLSSDELTAAIAAFQASVGLEPTGIYDEATAAALTAALGVYSSLLTDSTAGLQQLLQSLGLYSGPIDGIWNAELTEAMKGLQRALGVPETGVPDAATLQAIYERGVVDGSTVPPVPEPTVPPPPPETTAPPPPPQTTAPPAPPETTPPPAPLPDLFATLQADPDYSTFVELLLAAGFSADIEVVGTFTVFAPTNAAFEQLPAGTLDAWKADPELLKAILGYHIVEGVVSSSGPPGDLTTVNGAILVIAAGDAGVTVGGATIVDPDIAASNGVIQGIDQVLEPPTTPE